MSDDTIKRLRDAIAAGPTPGPWKIRAERYRFIHVYATGGGICHLDTVDGEGAANAKLIAAASPDNITALLDRLEAAERENERLRALEGDVLNTLPGVYYMDSPDGGDVSLLQQLKRMANDAARYRLLRRKFAIISDGESNAEFCPINLPRPTYIAPNTAIELDTALDRERLGLDGAKRPPTPVGWSDTDWIKHLQEQDELERTAK